jgi:hypothetical protein
MHHSYIQYTYTNVSYCTLCVSCPHILIKNARLHHTVWPSSANWASPWAHRPHWRPLHPERWCMQEVWPIQSQIHYINSSKIINQHWRWFLSIKWALSGTLILTHEMAPVAVQIKLEWWQMAQIHPHFFWLYTYYYSSVDSWLEIPCFHALVPIQVEGQKMPKMRQLTIPEGLLSNMYMVNCDNLLLPRWRVISIRAGVEVSPIELPRWLR